MARPFNSSNTAEESAAVTSNCWLAEKWRVPPAGSSASSKSVPSARMRTRVAAEVETARSRGTAAEEVKLSEEGRATEDDAAPACVWIRGGNKEDDEDSFAARCAAKRRQPYIPPAMSPPSTASNASTARIGTQIGGRG